MNPMHLKQSPNWHTPAAYVEAARAVMGRIDLDPASDTVANQTIKAKVFYTEHDNGLDYDWVGRVFLNPPGGLVREFWLKLVESSAVTECIWIGYSLEQLQFLQQINANSTPLNFPLCIPRRRIAFDLPGSKKKSPTHANYVAYLTTQPLRDARFMAAFRQFGEVFIPGSGRFTL